MFCFNSENFLRLQIFYEDLSVFKTISEEAYKVSNLMESGFSDGQKPRKTSHLEKKRNFIAWNTIKERKRYSNCGISYLNFKI